MAIDLQLGGTRASPIMSIATPIRDITPSVTAKGLTNRPGQNNCFLNSSIQVLWHLDVFRRSFRDLTGHACLAESCIFCALKELFSELQHSRAKALPPDSLRKALADSFLDQRRFQLGFMDDAAECFENMLLRIHEHVAHREPEDACTAPHCISHQKFAMTLLEQSVCGGCGATTEPMSFTQMVQYVSTSTLVHQLRFSIGQTGRPDTFGRLLQKAASMGETRQCPSSCGSVTQMCRVLMNRPEIVSIGLVWNSEKPSLDHIMEVFSCIDTTLRLSHVFNTVTDSKWAEVTTHNLVGVVTYYGKHYSTFFFHTKLMEWIFFDDATVRDVGPRWEQVVEKCRKGKFQPLLLLYASPNGTPVNLEFAPKINTPFYTDKIKAPINQQLLRRSVTPSPEKPMIGNTRRAITPNPDNSSLNHKPPLPKPYNEYQNLSVIQKNISNNRDCDQVDGCLMLNRKLFENVKPQVNVHRTLSNGSSSGVESGVCIPDHLNTPRRRDSGNWSGDRNSASSASSTTMENPYLYLVGKMPPGSPTKIKTDALGIAAYDAGYDSYSLSSNDSTNMTTLQHMMKTGYLAQIPEDYNNVVMNQNSQSCDVLCDEADQLLVKSRQLEDAHDLVLALALCNAAATKARAAMNAPYNNPQTLTLARMKHNTCIMRARSLHRRMTQSQPHNKDNALEIRHTREGSSGSGRHSRQNSKDKGHHSRQNSRELLLQQEKEKAKPIKNIEIYATLPKKKDALKAKINAINIEDAEYMLYSSKAPERESRSIFSRSKNKDNKVKEKRSRSEDRNKISRGDLSIAPEIKDTLKKAKENKEKEEKKDKDGKNKKQHKIRRKLLMGGLIRRKNRSMPDLTDSCAETEAQSPVDANVSTRCSPENVHPGMTGYLSEGHLEFTGATANPNLERSKLMRKSFHGSAGKILTAAKVPPPPPLRTTSQLSRSKSNMSEVGEKENQFNFYGETQIYHNLSPFNQSMEEQSTMSLPYYGNSNSSYDDDSFGASSSRTIVTQADVHQEPCSEESFNINDGVDEVDCLPSHSTAMLELPPYPSPSVSAIHSRQASEDFPPPPPPLDLSALDEYLPKLTTAEDIVPEPNSLLAQLQNKREEILTPQKTCKVSAKTPALPSTRSSGGDIWLKELQAKQAALRIKKNETMGNKDDGIDEVNTQRYVPGEAKVKSVKDLASKFEHVEINNMKTSKPMQDLAKTNNMTTKPTEFPALAPEQIAEEIREVEMITSAVNKVFDKQQQEEQPKSRPLKKKSVSFCDQVTLVATAEEQEDDTYIPNPILERVLRSAVNNSETKAVRQELLTLRDKNGIIQAANDIEQPVYIRRNSVENLLNQEHPRRLPNEDSQVLGYPQQQYSASSQHNNVRPDEQYYSAYSQNSNNLYNSQNQHQQFLNNNDPIYPINGYYNKANQQNGFNAEPIQQPEAHQFRNYPQSYSETVSVGSTVYSLNTHRPLDLQIVPSRQSPYQSVPQAVHHNFPGPAVRGFVNNSNYGYAPRPAYNQATVRTTTPSPSYMFNHSPSPVPSVNSCNTCHADNMMYRNNNYIQSAYQRVPVPHEYAQNYLQSDQQYQRQSDVYQRVPQPRNEEPLYPSQIPKTAPFRSVPSPKHNLMQKTVSFQPGTKGGCESPVPKAVVTPIVVNNANNSVPTDKTKCSLCRKKNVVALNVYCKDCEFYMSRFKPKA